MLLGNIKNGMLLMLMVMVAGMFYFLREQQATIDILAESHMELMGFMKEQEADK